MCQMPRRVYLVGLLCGIFTHKRGEKRVDYKVNIVATMLHAFNESKPTFDEVFVLMCLRSMCDT